MKIVKIYHIQQLQITEVVLVHFDIVNNDYQQDLRALYIVPNKSFCDKQSAADAPKTASKRATQQQRRLVI